MGENEICLVEGGKICINHATFNAVLKATHVYCILSQEAESNHEGTTIDINEMECVTFRVGVEEADKVAEEYSQCKLNLISKY
jgi:hypothetical protein